MTAVGQVTQPIRISSSPVKDDSNSWISHLSLYMSDKDILDSRKWLNDAIIYAAQSLLRDQTKGKVFGWQSTQCSKRDGMFQPIPPNSLFVQILHVHQSHWIVVSNIDGKSGGSFSDTVCIFDSDRPLKLSHSIKKMVCSFFKAPSDALHFDIMNVQGQNNSFDCGVFAIAYATELAYGYDSVICCWDDGKMRQHLKHCLENGCITRFPTRGERTIPLGMRTLNSVLQKIYCICGMPNTNKKRPMVMCDGCLKWYHGDCMSIDCDEVGKSKWICCQCTDVLNELKK